MVKKSHVTSHPDVPIIKGNLGVFLQVLDLTWFGLLTVLGTWGKNTSALQFACTFNRRGWF